MSKVRSDNVLVPVSSSLPDTAPPPSPNDVIAPADAFAPVAATQANDPTRLARIQQLEDVIKKAITTLMPHDMASLDPTGNTFNGNYDWHSCVHAHWALLGMAHETGDTALEKWVLDRLSPQVLAKEAGFLSNPARADFEMPYGQEWLLLLLGEMARRPDQRTPQLMTLKNETEARVVNWLKTSPFPESATGPIGSHRSWLFAYWMLQMSGPSAPTQAALNQIKHDRIDPNRDVIAKWTPTDYDFLYLPAVLALIDSTGDHPTEHSAYPPGAEGKLPASVGSADAHTAGAAMVRVWPYAVEAATGDPAARATTEKRLAEMFANPAVWKNDFHDVAHWVPQFAWMAMWLENGARPYEPLAPAVA